MKGCRHQRGPERNCWPAPKPINYNILVTRQPCNSIENSLMMRGGGPRIAWIELGETWSN